MLAHRHARREGQSPVQRLVIGRDSVIENPGEKRGIDSRRCTGSTTRTVVGPPEDPVSVAGNQEPRGRLARTEGTPEMQEQVPQRSTGRSTTVARKTQKETISVLPVDEKRRSYPGVRAAIAALLHMVKDAPLWG